MLLETAAFAAAWPGPTTIAYQETVQVPAAAGGPGTTTPVVFSVVIRHLSPEDHPQPFGVFVSNAAGTPDRILTAQAQAVIQGRDPAKPRTVMRLRNAWAAWDQQDPQRRVDQVHAETPDEVALLVKGDFQPGDVILVQRQSIPYAVIVDVDGDSPEPTALTASSRVYRYNLVYPQDVGMTQAPLQLVDLSTGRVLGQPYHGADQQLSPIP